MKRASLLLLSCATACASVRGGGDRTGAETPVAAIQMFLAAAQRQDLTALAAVWGTSKGAASRDRGLRDRLERSEFIMISCLPHEKAVVGAPSPGERGRLRFPVEVTLVTLKATPVFEVVRGPGRRWYVYSFDMDHMREKGFCGATPVAPARPPGVTR